MSVFARTTLQRFAATFAIALVACGGGEDAPRSQTPTPTPTPVVPAPSTPVPDARLERRGAYLVDVGRDCDGFPRLTLETPPGLCVGLVLDATHATIAAARGKFRPRTIVEDPRHGGVFWVVDTGARRESVGRLWRIAPRDGDVAIVAERLDRPHGSGIGPDGWLYVGEVHRIVRFDPGATDPGTTMQVVIDGLPTHITGRDRIRFHPLKAFVFAPNGDLVVNMGSSTDYCEESVSSPVCHDELEHNAAVWRFAYRGDRTWARTPTYLAHGLRNSVALAAHRSGTLVQGENGTDFPEPDRPHEELNEILPGRHYGWPYCYDRDVVDTRWAHARFACDPAANPRYAPPLVLLPPHGAPLGLAYYEGTRLPALHGRLLISLHGYRALGHRILAVAVDEARGLPTRNASLETVIAGWDASDTGPKGAPVGLAVARDGSVFVVEDNNGTVLRLSIDAFAHLRTRAADGASGAPERADPVFTAMHRDVLRPRCAHCHDFLAGEADAALAALLRESWLGRDGAEPLLRARTRRGSERRMPLDATLRDEELAAIDAWLRTRTPPR